MSKPKKSVKLVPMKTDDIERLYKICESTGIPFRILLSQLVNRGSELVLLSNGKLDEVVVLFKALKNLSRLGFLLVPSTIMNKLASSNPELISEMLRVGKAVGAVYAINGYNSIDELKGIVSMLFLDASQVSVKEQEGRLKIAIAVPGRSIDSIKLSTSFLEGFLSELNYKKVREEINENIIILDYEKAG